MLKKITGLLFVFLLAPGLALADQAEWVSKKFAEQAAKILKQQKNILEFCEPCKDTEKKIIPVEEVSIEPTEGDYWTVTVNGDGMDLAYTFIEVKGKWVNVARKLRIPDIHGVSATLPVEKAASKEPPQKGASSAKGKKQGKVEPKEEKEVSSPRPPKTRHGQGWRKLDNNKTP